LTGKLLLNFLICAHHKAASQPASFTCCDRGRLPIGCSQFRNLGNLATELPSLGSSLIADVIFTAAQLLGGEGQYERFSTIITTNLEFKDWTSVFGTQQLTNGLLNRLVHRCQIVPMNGESYRFKESVRRKRKTAGTIPVEATRSKTHETAK